MQCPVCGAALVDRREGLFEDIVVHHCGACSGTFYPAGTLDRLDDALFVNAEELPLEASAGQARPCPACSVNRDHAFAGPSLAPRRFAGDRAVEVGVCPACEGFWLNDASLDRVRQLVLERSAEDNQHLNAPLIGYDEGSGD
jgi:Zn-finger nucleic acid-binding protein